MSHGLPGWITQRAPDRPVPKPPLLSRSLGARAALLLATVSVDVAALYYLPVFAWVLVLLSIPGLMLTVMRTQRTITPRWKLATAVAGAVVVTAVLLLTPSHLSAAEEANSYDQGLLSGLYMFSVTSVLGALFVAFMSVEPGRFRMRYYVLVMALLVAIDVVVFVPERAPAGYHSYALGALPAMWLFTVLIPISMLAYPGRYRSLPQDHWI